LASLASPPADTASPARADELDPLGLGRIHELLGELLLINPIRHRLDSVAHYWSFPRAALGVSDQLHRSSDTPETRTRVASPGAVS
jgi:hypothetical protein